MSQPANNIPVFFTHQWPFFRRTVDGQISVAHLPVCLPSTGTCLGQFVGTYHPDGTLFSTLVPVTAPGELTISPAIEEASLPFPAPGELAISLATEETSFPFPAPVLDAGERKRKSDEIEISSKDMLDLLFMTSTEDEDPQIHTIRCIPTKNEEERLEESTMLYITLRNKRRAISPEAPVSIQGDRANTPTFTV